MPVDLRVVSFHSEKQKRTNTSIPSPQNTWNHQNIALPVQNSQVSHLYFTKEYQFHVTGENMLNAFMQALILCSFHWCKQNLSATFLLWFEPYLQIQNPKPDFCVRQWDRFCLVAIKLRKLANITKINSKQLISPDVC